MKEYETKTLDKDRVEEEVNRFLATGFNNVKVKIGLLDLDQDVEKIRFVRELIGENRGMFIDPNHAYNMVGAKDLLRRIAEYGIGFVEEPLPPEDREGYASLRQYSPIPIAGGECEFTAFGFRDLINRRCVDILQPDLCASGGYSEFIKIRSLAYAHNILLVPHVWGSAVGLSAALQAIAHLPNVPHTALPIPGQNAPMIEFDQSPNPLRTDIVEEEFHLEDGCLKIPQGPGLGITVRKEKLKQFCK
jgi:D-galactarolactone cycloisomerase